MTRLADFMRDHKLTDVRLATRAGLTPAQLGSIGRDASDPKLPTMRAIARAASSIVGRKVRLTEIFDLGDGEQ
jgi:DNA-binding XRE family transcriptional regulator